MNQNNDSNVADNPASDMVEEAKMGGKYHDSGLFPADRLIKKMGENMAIAEAGTDENPLWTEKTAELEKNEQQKDDNER
jgi:hypothetical protein